MIEPNGRETNAEYSSPVPILNSGDVLDSDEFFRRYAASPGNVAAERINGRVYLMSPLRAASHGDPHALFATWLGTRIRRDLRSAVRAVIMNCVWRGT
ncbi:hypothetical protein TBK1r_40870 [Stieleria magnilauensis]|uniref:Restriction endonuclease domain-containing protein n=1 Tax=Stieleria magnilauensis TaxID=2527963 RepID=A0ABX5XSZ6_9BACT|nr:hypothetical protein TBK1r_40870 [Planctomycetes bacterium TBK1r]